MKRIGIIGSGTLGSHLTAFFAGCGCDVMLFGRKGGAARAKARLPKLKPGPLYALSDSKRIEAVDLKDGAARMKECEWIIECVSESMDAKRGIYETVSQNINDEAICTSATSGITLSKLAPLVSDQVKPRFFITHFFFPPRRMKLVEIVAGDDTNGEAVEKISSFLSERCGKGVVRAKDTPNFIANRIGVHHVMDAYHRVAEKGWFIEAVDTIMGVPLGRPSTGIFRMADMVGIDTVAAVAGTAAAHAEEDPYSERCRIPQYLQQMVVKGWHGLKGGQGFYKNAGEKRYVYDPMRGTYRPRISFKPRSLIEFAEEPDVAKRMRGIVFANDQGGEIAWDLISTMLVHAADVSGEISDDVESIDRAMRWGYGWELGPFEIWDALGVRDVSERLARENRPVPDIVRDLLHTGRNSFYERQHQHALFPSHFSPAIEKNPAGEFADMGKGVGLLTVSENAAATTKRLNELIDHALVRVEYEWRALVIAGPADSLTWTYNLYDLLNKARLGRFGDIDEMLKEQQNLAQRIYRSPAPVVMVTSGKLSGVAAELSLSTAHRHSWVETQAFFNHLLLGLVPAAGGCLRLLRQASEHEKRLRSAWKRGPGMCSDGGPHPAARKAFELLGGVARSQSAYDAQDMGVFSPSDTVTMDRDRVVEDALRIAHTVASTYEVPSARPITMTGKGGRVVLKQAMNDYARKGLLRADDARVCEHLAHVLTGGNAPVMLHADERYVLDLEREAFLSLIGTPMTQARIEYYLKTGKYLR
jgi:3-hydroxyacyl-CoA dehydrogenase